MMTAETMDRLPDGWEWVRTDGARIEIDRSGGPSLLGERSDRDGWRIVYRIERDEAVFVDRLGKVPERDDPRETLARAARYVEDYDLPVDHLGELLAVEGESIRCREWRFE